MFTIIPISHDKRLIRRQTSTVRSVLNNVANENSSSRTLNCNDPYGACKSGVIAYTYVDGRTNSV